MMQPTPIQLYGAVGDSIGMVSLVDRMGDDKRIVDAARVSFLRDAPDVPFHEVKDRQLVRYLMRNRHTSPFEHCVITWRFTVPIFTRAQHMRHRTWAYNEESRRYLDALVEPLFYLPSLFHMKGDTAEKQLAVGGRADPVLSIRAVNGIHEEMAQRASNAVRDVVEFAMARYVAMCEAGIDAGEARMVLPQNMFVNYFGTVNLHNALKFLMLRDSVDGHAQWQIRMVGDAMASHLTELFPITMEAFNDFRPRPQKVK